MLVLFVPRWGMSGSYTERTSPPLLGEKNAENENTHDAATTTTSMGDSFTCVTAARSCLLRLTPALLKLRAWRLCDRACYALRSRCENIALVGVADCCFADCCFCIAYSAEELEEFKEAFALFDDKGENAIDAAKLGTVLRSLGFTPTEADVSDMTSKAGASVTYEALLGFVQQAKEKTVKESDVSDALKVFDKEGNGSIPVDEVKRILSQLGEKLSDKEVTAILQEADPRKTGAVQFDFFLGMVKAFN